MLKTKKSSSSANSIETTQAFRQSFLCSLSKLSSNSTLKTGLEEIRELLTIHMKDNERLMIVLNSLSEIHQQHQKPSTRKEYIRVFGLIAEIYEDKILEIFPKIVMNLNKRLKEGDNQLNQAISETMGQVIEHVFKHIDPNEAMKPLSSAIFLFFENFLHDQKNTQIGSAMCISRIIQTSPVNCLEFLMPKIVNKLKEAFISGYCKSQTQLLESLLSLILGVEEKFQDFLDDVLPIILESMLNSDWTVRKIANDIIYTLCVLIPEGVVTHNKQIIKHLNGCRFDKIKHVRDAAAMAINIVKEIKGIEWEEKVEAINNYMEEDEDNYNEYEERREFMINPSCSIKNSFFKENLMERKLNSSKKTASKKPGILTRPINPDFLKNAVQKNDGIEIKTNQPLLPLAQNNDSTNRNAFEMEFQSDKEGGVSLRNFLESKKKERISPTKSIAHVSNDIEYVQKSLKASAKKMKTPSQENSNQKNMNNKEYSEIMEKMNQIIIQQNMLFDKYNYIENDLKKQLKSTVSRLDQLENLFHLNFRPAGSQINQIPEQRPYYVNYQVPYQQIPNNMNNLDSGVYLNKPTNYMSFGQSKISNERPEIKPVNYDFLSRNPNNPTANNNEINYNEGFYLNNQAMKLENILNTNYLTFSPSKKQGLEEKDLENKTIESVLQRTPKKTINL